MDNFKKILVDIQDLIKSIMENQILFLKKDMMFL